MQQAIASLMSRNLCSIRSTILVFFWMPMLRVKKATKNSEMSIDNIFGTDCIGLIFPAFWINSITFREKDRAPIMAPANKKIVCIIFFGVADSPDSFTFLISLLRFIYYSFAGQARIKSIAIEMVPCRIHAFYLPVIGRRGIYTTQCKALRKHSSQIFLTMLARLKRGVKLQS